MTLLRANVLLKINRRYLRRGLLEQHAQENCDFDRKLRGRRISAGISNPIYSTCYDGVRTLLQGYLRIAAPCPVAGGYGSA